MLGGRKLKNAKSKSIEREHKRAQSLTTSVTAGVLKNNPAADSSDLNSVSSANSFISLQMAGSATGFGKFGGSFDSINSVPDHSHVGPLKKPKKKGIFGGKKVKSTETLRTKKKGIGAKAGFSGTIIEDDESDAVLNIPVLPAFERAKSADAIVGGNDRAAGASLGRIEKNVSVGAGNDANAGEERVLRSVIDHDFDFTFSRDSEAGRGEHILEMRKRRGVQGRRLIETGSSSDDTSTEGEGDSDDNEDDGGAGVVSINDEKTDPSADASKKRSFKNLFRRRMSLPEKSSISSDDELADNEKLDGVHVDNIDGFGGGSAPRLGVNQGEHFLQGVFQMDGLLSGGGMVPTVNIAQNAEHQPETTTPHQPPSPPPPRRGDTVYDEENPPPNFLEEIQDEAEALVGQVFKTPFENMRKRRVSRVQEESNDEDDARGDDGFDNSGMYLPEDAQVLVNPFDDLQDFDNFCIDVPEGFQDKPRRLRAGIQSSLMQVYNTHMFPDSSAASSSGASSKMDRLAGGTQSLFSGAHKRAASFQEKYTKKAGKGLGKHSGSTTGANRGVSFELPDFGNIRSAATPETEGGTTEPSMFGKIRKRARLNKRQARETTARITVHIADVLERQRFILTLCKAFMLYGAPTHRLEEYMSLTAQVLEMDGSFIYFPGCMLVSFGDGAARTSQMRLVRCAQGLDLAKLDEVHAVYKNVVHDRLGTVAGYGALDQVLTRPPSWGAPWCVFFYAVASLAVAPFGFGGSWIDLPICFALGAVIGFLQFVVCPRNTLYSSVFEVTSSIIASFLARAIGSVNGGTLFCYASLVQSPLALILPGYIILCGSLELQSRNIVAGSVRMFYAFIYSLMLSFGITLGAALYGWIDAGATSTTTCSSDISPWWRILFVPLFTVAIALTNQASWSQLPMMVVISGAGYVVTYFSGLHFKQVTELNATLGCFIVGLVSNIYSRFMKSFNKYFTSRGSFMTVSLMLPAIFVQVPSGIASQSSVFTGITTANNIVHSNSTASTTNDNNSLSFGRVMIQVALGISVGLYLSTIIVYPFGKKKTGLFTL